MLIATWTSEPESSPSYFGELDASGRWIRRPARVAVPWGFGALAFNGTGYHLALFYDGASYGQTRLSMVTLSVAGRPEQHPWWVSRPEAVADPQLIRARGGMVAVWRGGTDEGSLHSSTITAIGQWGQEAGAPKRLGPIRGDQIYAIQTNDDGTWEVVKQDGSSVTSKTGE